MSIPEPKHITDQVVDFSYSAWPSLEELFKQLLKENKMSPWHYDSLVCHILALEEHIGFHPRYPIYNELKERM